MGNLPYNVSTPILFRMAEVAPRLRDCVFMLQREVVERMVAKPGTPAYGRLSVMLQYRFAMALVLRVPPGAFTPPPKSSPRGAQRPPGRAAARRDEERFAGIVAAACRNGADVAQAERAGTEEGFASEQSIRAGAGRRWAWRNSSPRRRAP